MTRPPRPVRLGVVVPVRNEERRLQACLESVDRAGIAVGQPVDVVVVLDSCTDGSRSVALAAAGRLGCRVHVVEIEARRVGAARRAGADWLLGELGDEAWVATTDADSVVPPDWFVRQLAHRDRGAALVVGTVCVADWEGRHLLRIPWTRAYESKGTGHVHGANLSFSAAGYRRAGGFLDCAHDEDVRLVGAFLDGGQSVVWASDLAVTTSARRTGRSPHGFAGYLNALESRLAPAETHPEPRPALAEAPAEAR